jgi:hypothetical protein
MRCARCALAALRLPKAATSRLSPQALFLTTDAGSKAAPHEQCVNALRMPGIWFGTLTPLLRVQEPARADGCLRRR